MKLRQTILPIIASVTLLIVLTISFIPSTTRFIKGFYRPLSTAVNAGSELISDVLAYFPDNKKRSDKIDELRREIASLRMEAVRNEERVAENRRLRDLLDLEIAPDWIVRTARINGKDPMHWNRMFEINKGRSDGVIKGAGVLAGTDVVGRIEEVSEHSATVLTILDPLCRLSVRLTDGDSVAILEGRYTVRAGKSLCRLNYLSPDTDFQEGMEVTTSGLSRVIPGGLKIGMLKPWDEEQDFNTESPVYKQALMQPAARFGSFRFVRIVYKADARDEIELE